jgi:thiamine pyrophosphate-dependent acetolactate synthase large subunit-like protein
MTFGNPDFVSYTQAYGIAGSRVERVEGLVPTLEAAFVRGGVQLVTVPIDYSENMRVWSTGSATTRQRDGDPAASNTCARSLGWGVVDT